MKLRNKRTGEIVDFRYLQSDYVVPLVLTTYKNDKPENYSYNSLTELNEEWEDAPEEPKGYWFINASGWVDFIALEDDTPEGIDGSKQIGNYFETKEEAEQSVEKLKAWKRLKDKGFVFKGINMSDSSIKTGLSKGVSLDDCEGFYSDMESLFGGVE